jgi:hypothetical protein
LGKTSRQSNGGSVLMFNKMVDHKNQAGLLYRWIKWLKGVQCNPFLVLVVV